MSGRDVKRWARAAVLLLSTGCAGVAFPALASAPAGQILAQVAPAPQTASPEAPPPVAAPPAAAAPPAVSAPPAAAPVAPPAAEPPATPSVQAPGAAQITPQPDPDPLNPEDAVLAPVPVLTKKGSASWEAGYEIIVQTLKAVTSEMNRLGLKRTGDVTILYTASDDAGFEFEAQIPFEGATTEKPRDGVVLGASFAGKALKFTHKGTFADMDVTYEAIANTLDVKNLEAQDSYLEIYRTDPMTTAPDALEVDIYVPLR